MEDELFQFRWPVPDKGFLWDTQLKPTFGAHTVETPTPAAFLTKNPTSQWEQYYSPLEKKELFLKFARLNTPDDFLCFAARYGWLGEGIPVEPPGGGAVTLGEPQATWQSATQEMRVLVQIWDWLEAKNAGKLGQVIVWAPGLSTVEFHGNKLSRTEYSVIASKPLRYNVELLQRWRPGDIYGPARLFILKKLNEKLKGVVSPCLLLKEDGTLGGFFRPHNLLAALWFQVYQAVSGERKFRRCEVCHELMDITENRKTIRQHPECANLRHVRKSRARKKVAEMHQEGMSASEIAAVMKIPASDVERIIHKGVNRNAT